MIKLGRTYYMFASMMTGWDSNENQYTTSTSLSGGWSSWKKFADSGSKVSEPARPFIPFAFHSCLVIDTDKQTPSPLQTDVQLPNNLHPQDLRVQRNLPRRPLDEGQPDGVHLRLAPAQHQHGHQHRHHEELCLVDPQLCPFFLLVKPDRRELVRGGACLLRRQGPQHRLLQVLQPGRRGLHRWPRPGQCHLQRHQERH